MLVTSLLPTLGKPAECTMQSAVSDMLRSLSCFLFRSHSDITTLSEDDLNDELARLEEAMKKILGVKPRLFRPPYGNYNDESLRVLSNRGYSSKCPF